MRLIWGYLFFFASTLCAQNTRNLIYFEFGKSTLSSLGKEEIKKMFKGISNDIIASINVVGHTDSVGSLEDNLVLSKQRATIVTQYLIEELGFPEKLIRQDYLGETKPFNSEPRDNRRVELSFDYINPCLGYFPEEEEPDRDTVISQDCLTLELEAGTFAPYNNSEVNIEVVILNNDNMDDYDVTLRDENNMPLISGGMFYLKATVDGKTVEQKKAIKACIPANNYPETISNRMMAYEGKRNAEGKIVWERTERKCIKGGSRPINLKNKPCDCYEVTFNGGSGFFNCDCGCGVGKKSKIEIPRIENPKILWSKDNYSYAIRFLDEEIPQDVVLKYTPSPIENLGVLSNALTYPPMFQKQHLHKDLLIQSDLLPHDATKTIRLFVNRNLDDDYGNSISPDTAPNLVFDRVKVYSGKLNEKGAIEWHSIPYKSDRNDVVHCFYLVYDLPFTGYYKIVSKEKETTFNRHPIVKVRGPKNAKVLVAHQQKNYVYYQLSPYKKRKKKFMISTVDDPSNVIMKAEIQHKKYILKAELLLSKLKCNRKGNKYILRRKYFTRFNKNQPHN